MEPVPRCDLSNYQPISQWHCHYAIEAGVIPSQKSCFSSATQWLTLIGEKQRHRAWRSCSHACRSCKVIFSLRNSTYMRPFTVLLWGTKCKPAELQHDMAPQIIWLGVCCIEATTYLFFLTRWTPNIHVTRYKLLYRAFDRKQHFLRLIESPMATKSHFLHHWCECVFRAGLWDFNQNALLISQNSAVTYCFTF